MSQPKRHLPRIALLLTLFGTGCGATQPTQDPQSQLEEQRPIAEFHDVSTGQYHTCAISTEGAVACWGGNEVGQLGDGTTRRRPMPVWVGGVDWAIDVDAGAFQTCALLQGSTVTCWGGGNRQSARTRPSPLSGVRGPMRWIAVGVTVCGIDLPGRSYCWDSSGYGGAVLSSNPIQLATTRPAQFVDVGLDRVCLVSAPDTAECFAIEPGSSEGGDLYFRRMESELAISNGLQLAVSGRHACVTGHGHISCWGENEHGQLGDGTQISSVQPMEIDLGEPAMHVTTGWHHSCAVVASGAVKCWGDNSFGQLGDGTTRSSNTPVSVVGIRQPAVRIAAGMGHTCVVTVDRDIYCWGLNQHGQIGDGSYRNHPTPTRTLSIRYPFQD